MWWLICSCVVQQHRIMSESRGATTRKYDRLIIFFTQELKSKQWEVCAGRALCYWGRLRYLMHTQHIIVNQHYTVLSSPLGGLKSSYQHCWHMAVSFGKMDGGCKYGLSSLPLQCIMGAIRARQWILNVCKVISEALSGFIVRSHRRHYNSHSEGVENYPTQFLTNCLLKNIWLRNKVGKEIMLMTVQQGACNSKAFQPLSINTSGLL